MHWSGLVAQLSYGMAHLFHRHISQVASDQRQLYTIQLALPVDGGALQGELLDLVVLATR